MNIDSEPTVSIIVPVYKVEPYLRRCLDSICAQSLTNIEIITVNDASPDGCSAILDEYAKRDQRIRVITHERNQGVSAARNSGLEAAKGKYIGFVDSDDYIEATMYETLVRRAEESQADIVYCGARIVDENDVVSMSCLNDDAVYDLENSTDRRLAFRRVGFWCYNKLFRRETITGIRFPPLIFSEDGAFNVACFCASRRICSVPVSPYFYFARPGSSSKTITPRGIDDYGRFVELTRDLLRKRGYNDLWSAFASEGRSMILKYTVRAIYQQADRNEQERLWRNCLERDVSILLEPGFQPAWRRLWFRLAFAPRNLWLAYWTTSVPSRLEEKYTGLARTIIKGARQRGWRAAVADHWHNRGTKQAATPVGKQPA